MPYRVERDAAENDLVIEVDGEGVHLDTLDAPRVLELAVAYLELLKKIADERDEDIQFVGIEAREKCGLLATRPSDPELARQLALDSHKLLASLVKPRGLGGVIDRVRDARAKLPSNYTARVRIHGFDRPISAEPSSALKETPYSATSLRAYVVRVGGRRPRAAFRSKSEARQFSLDLGERLAKELSPHLYSEVDIDALVARDPAGNIEEGTLRAFYVLSKGDPQATWNEWFNENGITAVEDLKRDDEGEDGPA